MRKGYILYALLPLAVTAASAQDSVRVTSKNGSFSVTARFSAPRWIPQVTDAPYSAEETQVTIQTLADGTHITRTGLVRKVYRDAAGRTRTERQLTPPPRSSQRAGEMPMLIEITDPVEHVQYVLDPEHKVAHKQAIPVPETRNTKAAASAAPALKPPASDTPQSTREKLGTQTIEGVEVEGTRHTTLYPAGSYMQNDQPIKVVGETWWSPELKLAVLTTSNDPLLGEVTHKLTNLERREPDLSLFMPPTDYTVVEEKSEFTIEFETRK